MRDDGDWLMGSTTKTQFSITFNSFVIWEGIRASYEINQKANPSQRRPIVMTDSCPANYLPNNVSSKYTLQLNAFCAGNRMDG
jgi:hypothetical protein